MTAGFAVGAVLSWSTLAATGGTAPDKGAARRPTLAQQAAGELARSRVAARRMAPTLRIARDVARRVARRGELVHGVVTPTHVVASVELVRHPGVTRTVPAQGGVHFTICVRVQPCDTPESDVSRSQARAAGRQALELAVRTFLGTRAPIVIVAVPRVGGPPTVVLFERRELLRLVAGHLSDSGAIDRLVDSHLYELAGLVATSAGQDALVLRSRSATAR